MTAFVPRPEYPRPQFVRSDWLCLNGEWEFEIDAGDSGLERGLLDRELADRITVPFCPEAPLSGIGNQDFMAAVWYRRQVTIPESWTDRHVLLHFQAVDYDATVWVDGAKVGRHRGGFTPFSCELADVDPGQSITIVVRAQDDKKSPQARGKQTTAFHPSGCVYPRVTGIWQPVWLEPVPATRLERPRITPDVANSRFRIEQPVRGPRRGCTIVARLQDDTGDVSEARPAADADSTTTLDLRVPSDRLRLWSPEDPHLYGITLELLDPSGHSLDRAESYGGLRSVVCDAPAVLINGRSVFQRLVLDQGWWPDGYMTAPSDAALVADIELAQSVGFNGARVHQKVAEERYLFHADRLGFLVWGEFGDWGVATPQGPHHHGVTIVSQWIEAMQRDYSHPCIVGWCPLNESYQRIRESITPLDDLTRALFLASKAQDSTRPVLDASGGSHRIPESDVYDMHDYEQDPEKLQKRFAEVADGPLSITSTWPDDSMSMFGPSGELSIPHAGQPFFVSEFGGMLWDPDAAPGEGWGYGKAPATLEEFYARFEALCSALLDNPGIFGYCYTQITDVFQERNGIFHFDRRAKFDASRIRAAQARIAAIEKDRG